MRLEFVSSCGQELASSPVRQVYSVLFEIWLQRKESHRIREIYSEKEFHPIITVAVKIDTPGIIVNCLLFLFLTVRGTAVPKSEWRDQRETKNAVKFKTPSQHHVLLALTFLLLPIYAPPLFESFLFVFGFNTCEGPTKSDGQWAPLYALSHSESSIMLYGW